MMSLVCFRSAHIHMPLKSLPEGERFSSLEDVKHES